MVAPPSPGADPREGDTGRAAQTTLRVLCLAPGEVDRRLPQIWPRLCCHKEVVAWCRWVGPQGQIGLLEYA